jgi:Tol biopolymer transport system component
VGRIVRIDADGKGRHVLASLSGEPNQSESDIRDLVWSPDGKWLAFASMISSQAGGNIILGMPWAVYVS